MTVLAARLDASPAASVDATFSGRQATILRLLLVAGCVAAAALAAWLGAVRPGQDTDFELARLLRGMALIKAALCLAAVAVLVWRFGHPVSALTAGAYLAGAWMMSGATMLVWQLTLIPAAALVFHAGEITLLVVAWRDRGSTIDRALSV